MVQPLKDYLMRQEEGGVRASPLTEMEVEERGPQSLSPINSPTHHEEDAVYFGSSTANLEEGERKHPQQHQVEQKDRQLTLRLSSAEQTGTKVEQPEENALGSLGEAANSLVLVKAHSTSTQPASSLANHSVSRNKGRSKKEVTFSNQTSSSSPNRHLKPPYSTRTADHPITNNQLFVPMQSSGSSSTSSSSATDLSTSFLGEKRDAENFNSSTNNPKNASAKRSKRKTTEQLPAMQTLMAALSARGEFTSPLLSPRLQALTGNYDLLPPSPDALTKEHIWTALQDLHHRLTLLESFTRHQHKSRAEKQQFIHQQQPNSLVLGGLSPSTPYPHHQQQGLHLHPQSHLHQQPMNLSHPMVHSAPHSPIMQHPTGPEGTVIRRTYDTELVQARILIDTCFLSLFFPFFLCFSLFACREKSLKRLLSLL